MRNFNEMQLFKTTVRRIKRPYTIAFILLWNLFVAFRIIESNTFNTLTFIFIAVGISFTLIAFKQLFTKLEIIITAETLQTRKHVFNWIYHTKTYLIKDIYDIKIINNAEEPTSWNFEGFYISDRTPAILSFIHKTNQIKLGLSYDWPTIDQTVRELKSRKNYA